MSLAALLSGSRGTLLAVAMLGFIIAATGCEGREGGHSRGLFVGYVTDKTEEEVTAKIGKPDSVDTSNPNTPKWVYKRKTFDPDNQNKVDSEALLIFQKDPASGQFKVTQVVFS